jgi:hypothetical protein
MLDALNYLSQDRARQAAIRRASSLDRFAVPRPLRAFDVALPLTEETTDAECVDYRRRQSPDTSRPFRPYVSFHRNFGAISRKFDGSEISAAGASEDRVC